MVNSIWRYSHLTLAIASSLFIVLAAVTGILLAIEPIADELQPYSSEHFDQLSLSETMVAMDLAYDEVLSLTIDSNHFLLADVLTKEGDALQGYFDPSTAAYLGPKKEKSAFFQFVTTLHRSLFLKSTGRFLVGLASFLLSLIALTGLLLIIKRQGGWRKIFSKIVYENFAQFYHVYVGRLSFVFIIILSLSGVYLSGIRFEVIPNKVPSVKYPSEVLPQIDRQALADLALFKTIPLAEVKTVEFPFSTDRSDYFTLTLHDKTLLVDQYNGQLVNQHVTPLSKRLASLNLMLHTGQGNLVWAVLLGLSCIAILFFVYSGFKMTLARKKTHLTNDISPTKAQYIVLVGSETGSTTQFANAFYQGLRQVDASAYIAPLTDLSPFKSAKHLIIFTSTYGLGEAPSNARHFLPQLANIQLPSTLTFSVVAFGSLAYANFCQYGEAVHEALVNKGLKPILEVHRINDKSISMFTQWLSAWQEANQLYFNCDTTDLFRSPRHLVTLTVTHKTSPLDEVDRTFLITLNGRGLRRAQPGDLLAIYPENDHRERVYSIGHSAGGVQLSVKHHLHGLGSGYLHRLVKGQKFKGRLISNPAFHFPKKAPQVIMVANGTGIAPFLGMLHQNRAKQKVHLFLGLREPTSLALYAAQLNALQDQRQLDQLTTVFSQAPPYGYVQDALAAEAEAIVKTLENHGVIMICGSLAMQEGVVEELAKILAAYKKKTVACYQKLGQIKTDCY